MRRQFTLYAVAATALIGFKSSASAFTDQETLLITNTAGSICTTVKEARGRSTAIQASGDVKAEISSLLGKLAGAGGSGAGKVIFSQEEYENFSREAAASLADGDRACRERIFNKMFDKLVSAEPPGQHEWTFITPQATEASSGSGLGGQDKHRKTTCTPSDGLAFIPSSAVERDFHSGGNSECPEAGGLNEHKITTTPEQMVVYVGTRKPRTCAASISMKAEVKVIAKDGKNRPTTPNPLATCQTGNPY